MGRVSQHTRVTVSGKRVKVKAHNRRGLSRQRAWRHFQMAGRALAGSRRAGPARRRQLRTAALVAGTAATAEIAAWTLFRGAGVALTGVALAAAGGAWLMKRYAQ